MHPAAINPEERARRLIAVTAQLSDLIDQETNLLAARRPSETKPIVDAKAKLAGEYAREVRAIARNSALIAGIPPALREELKSATKRFEAKAEAQKRLIGRVRRVTEGVIKAIADEAARLDAAQTGYGAQGAAPTPAKSGYAAPKPTTLALNEVV